VEQRLGPRLQSLGQRVQDVGDLVHPAALLARAGKHIAQGGPRPERAVAGHQPRLAQPAVAEVAQDRRPGVGALAVAVLDSEQLLDAVLAHPDDDEQAQPVVLAQAHRDVHPVNEQVGVAVKRRLRLRNCSCSCCQTFVSRLIELDDNPAASSPSRSLSAGSKSPVESPCR